MAAQYIPVLLAFAFAGAVAVALLAASLLLGRGRFQPARKRETYESGMPLLDTSRKRVSIRFFVVAMVFIVFDPASKKFLAELTISQVAHDSAAGELSLISGTVQRDSHVTNRDR